MQSSPPKASDPLLTASIESLLHRLNSSDQSTAISGRLFYHPVCIDRLQEGPSCGFVAMLLAAKTLGLPLPALPDCADSIASLMEWARQAGFTAQGELFSAYWACEVFKAHWPDTVTHCTTFPHLAEQVYDVLRGGRRMLMVPYDCDKNHEPCKRGGNAAHWALIVGFLLPVVVVESGSTRPYDGEIEWDQDGDKADSTSAGNALFKHLHLVAYHGKSRHPALWPYSTLASSNAQLNSTERVDENFRFPVEGISQGLRGLCVEIYLSEPD